MNQSCRQAILAELKSARDIADAADAAARDLTDEERASVTQHIEKAQQYKKAAEDREVLRKQLGDLSDGIGLLPDQQPAARPEQYTALAKGKSIGTAFTDSDAYKQMLASVPEGRFGEKARVQSQPYGVKDLITGVSDTSAGSLVNPQLLGLQPSALERPLTVRALFTPGSTTTDTIEYVQMDSMVNAAAPVPEATSTAADATTVAGGYKPESAFTLIKATASVKTIAHWIPATKRSLSDAAQVRTLIDTFLRYGLEEAFEDQLIDGDGTGENFTGLNHVSGVQTATGADALIATRIARRKVRIGGRAVPTAYVMNPVDWENIELLRDGDGRFLGQGPFSVTEPRLWGLPVVESEAVAEGTAWVADWRMGVIWDREQASIQVTDSHADFFVRNLVAILAEMRAAFGVLRPAAFVKITL